MTETHPLSDYVHCWTCRTRRDADGRYLHRAENPVLAHRRCSVCNDVLMPTAQPTVAEKLDRLGTVLREAYQAVRATTVDQPDSRDALALSRVEQWIEQATRLHTLELSTMPSGRRARDIADAVADREDRNR